jgi:hypothetical protein
MLFDFEMKHVRAESFKAEDVLSRRPPAPTDVSYDDTDPEDFLDAYNDLIYAGSSPPPDATVTSSFKFLLSSVHSRLSSPFTDSWTHKNVPISVFHSTKAFIDAPKPSSTSFQPELAQQTRLLPDFHHRKSYSTRVEEFLLGDELHQFEFIESDTYSQSIPLGDLGRGFVGHKHGIRDRDGSDFWQEIRTFLENGLYPPLLITDRQKLSFSQVFQEIHATSRQIMARA